MDRGRQSSRVIVDRSIDLSTMGYAPGDVADVPPALLAPTKFAYQCPGHPGHRDSFSVQVRATPPGPGPPHRPLAQPHQRRRHPIKELLPSMNKKGDSRFAEVWRRMTSKARSGFTKVWRSITGKGWFFLSLVVIGLIVAVYIDQTSNDGKSTGSILILGVTALAVVWYADATRQMVEEMKRQGAAAVAVFFDVAPENPNVIDIVVKNVGLRPAHHIEITPVDGSPPLTSNACRADASPDNLAFPFKPVVLLAPGQFYRRPFYDRTRSPELNLDRRVTLSWNDGLIGKIFAPPQDMTLRDFMPDIETGF